MVIEQSPSLGGTEAEVRAALDEVIHPSFGMSLIALGMVRAVRVEFLTRLYFISATHPQAARNLIEAQVEATRAGLARLTQMLVKLPPEQTFNRLGLELRLRQLTSMLAWMAECRISLGLD